MFKFKNLIWISFTFLIIIVDQITKYLALSHLALYQPVKIFPFLNLTLAYNDGVAFSLFNNGANWLYFILIAVTILISSFIFVWLGRAKSNEKLKLFSLSLILGGAVGNLINRIMLGYVIDFIDFYVKYWHWPAFNIADSAICVGVCLLLFSFISQKTT